MGIATLNILIILTVVTLTNEEFKVGVKNFEFFVTGEVRPSIRRAFFMPKNKKIPFGWGKELRK